MASPGKISEATPSATALMLHHGAHPSGPLAAPTRLENRHRDMFPG